MTHLLLALGLLTFPIACTASSELQPVALGTVHWARNADAALAASKQSGKPVFALFQEVPGCVGCRQFGKDVLSNPLIVEAIESEFTPLLIHNNAAGAGPDARALERFGEPAWNYQVVRFLDAAAQDIISRKDQVWTTGPLAERMISVVSKAGHTVPPYLHLLAKEHSSALKQAVFRMSCFWTGEMELGKIDGIITTEAGFLDGHEVTLVSYDPNMIALPALISAAEKVHCATAVWVPQADLADAKAARLAVAVMSGYRPAPADDQKKQLQGTAAAALNLKGAQATKLNAWVRVDAAKALSFLSPRQLAKLKQ
jgi:hypothetical protein